MPATRRMMFAALGVVALGALAWQGRALLGARASTGQPAASGTGSTAVVPQGGAHAGNRVQAEGRLVAYPGAEITVGSEIGGRIERLAVHEKDVVQRGALIAALDDAELQAAGAEARARLSEADADLALSEADLTRLTPLAANNDVSRQSLDRSRHARDAALARRELARASIQRLDAAIAKTRIVAPITGAVIARLANEGETLSPGSPIVRIADLRRVRVEAEVDEYDTHRLSVGDRATITAEGSRDAWHGRVEELPDAVIARRLTPQDPGRPTDVRVLLAKIALDAPTTLKLGQRVEVIIETAPPRGGDTLARRSIP